MRERAGPRPKRPPAERDETRPRAGTEKPRPRKHVSALRDDRAKAEKGPRRRIESAATEDRRGRKVVVERVSVAGKGRELGPDSQDIRNESRNARRFRAEREKGESRFDKPDRARKSTGGRDKFSGEAGAAKYFRREPGAKGSKSGGPAPRNPRGKK